MGIVLACALLIPSVARAEEPEPVVSIYTQGIARGFDRFDTARRLNSMFLPIDQHNKGLILVSGNSPSDAVVASSLAGLLDYHVLYTPKDTVMGMLSGNISCFPDPEYYTVSDRIAEIAPEKVIIMGDEASISSQVEEELRATISSIQVIDRIAGVNRFDTARKAYEYGIGNGQASDTAIVVSGVSFADSTSISQYASYTGAPVFLANNAGSLSDSDFALLESYSEVLIIGGLPCVSQATEDRISASSSVTRLAGTNRYATSCAVVSYLTTLEAKDGSGEKAFSLETIYFTTGENFADGTMAGITMGLSHGNECPLIILSNAQDVNNEPLKLIKGLAPYENRIEPTLIMELYTIGSYAVDSGIIQKIADDLGRPLVVAVG